MLYTTCFHRGDSVFLLRETFPNPCRNGNMLEVYVSQPTPERRLLGRYSFQNMKTSPPPNISRTLHLCINVPNPRRSGEILKFYTPPPSPFRRNGALTSVHRYVTLDHLLDKRRSVYV